MAVSKQQKIEILNGLIEKFKDAKSIGFAETNSITVEEFSNLRNDLREIGATYTLAKKTLIKKALNEALNIDIDLSMIPGQIGIVCSNEDAVSGLGKVNDFIKKNEKKIAWTCCIFEGELKDLEETKVIAGMPSRDTLLGRLVGSMQSPIAGLARFFDAASKDLTEKGLEKVGQLEGDKKEEVKEEKTEEAKVEETKEEATTEEK